MFFELSQIQPRIFYAKFDDCEHMFLSTHRIEGARLEQKNEYENYRQYIKAYLKKMTVNGYCVYSKDFRWFLRKFKKKKTIPEELNFAAKILALIKESGLNAGSKFAIIVCYNTTESIAYNHEM